MARPLKFKTPEDLQKKVDEYFDSNEKYTLSGLAVHLGITRQNLYQYSERDEFFDIIKRARQYVESHYEEKLVHGSNPTGVIFALKNMGWSDKSEVDWNVKEKPEWPELAKSKQNNGKSNKSA